MSSMFVGLSQGQARGWRGNRRSIPRQAGFTLVELLVVLVILGLLAAIATPQVMKYLGGAKTEAAKIQIRSLSTTLDLFRLDAGRYPTTEEGLQSLTRRPPNLERWNGPYVKKNDSLIDPWGVPYAYRSPGQRGEFDLYTLGADKVEGGTGEGQDVTSW